jgi:hypothetical protein
MIDDRHVRDESVAGGVIIIVQASQLLHRDGRDFSTAVRKSLLSIDIPFCILILGSKWRVGRRWTMGATS